MPYPHDADALKKWERGVMLAILKNPAPWNEYDDHIQMVCATYSRHLAGVAGYIPIDWQIIKAIAWVETGAGNPQWHSAPMQIGKFGDPGLRELLNKPAGQLILPPEYRRVLTVSNVPVNPQFSIEAGVGYLLKILANFGIQAMRQSNSGPAQSVQLPFQPLRQSGKAPEPVVRLGELWTAEFRDARMPGQLLLIAPAAPQISSSLSSTMRQHHPGHTAHSVRHKTTPVSRHLAIVSWKPVTLAFIAAHYNTGDGNYADKLRFSLDVMSGKL